MLVGRQAFPSEENLNVKHYRSELGKVGWIAVLLAVVGCCGPLARQVAAQDEPGGEAAEKWKVIEPDKKVKFPNKMTVLKRGKFESADEEKQFAEYYNKFSFPRWTMSDFRNRQPPQKDIVGEIHRELLAAAVAQDPQVYRKLADLLLAFMVPLSKGAEYHPLTRYNAMLAIAEANVPETVPILVSTVKDSKQLDAVKVAAMIGLSRHANANIVGIADADAAKLVTDAMVAIAAAPVAEGDKADGQIWMRGQAAEVLGLLGSPGRDGAVATALEKMIGDATLPVSQRCKAAHALGQLNWSGATVAAEPLIKALRSLATDVVALEKQGSPSRRRVVGNVQYVVGGLTAAAALAKTDAEKQIIDKVQKAIEPLLDPKVTPEILKENVGKAAANLEGK